VPSGTRRSDLARAAAVSGGWTADRSELGDPLADDCLEVLLVGLEPVQVGESGRTAIFAEPLEESSGIADGGCRFPGIVHFRTLVEDEECVLGWLVARMDVQGGEVFGSVAQVETGGVPLDAFGDFGAGVQDGGAQLLEERDQGVVEALQELVDGIGLRGGGSLSGHGEFSADCLIVRERRNCSGGPGVLSNDGFEDTMKQERDLGEPV